MKCTEIGDNRYVFVVVFAIAIDPATLVGWLAEVLVAIAHSPRVQLHEFTRIIYSL